MLAASSGSFRLLMWICAAFSNALPASLSFYQKQKSPCVKVSYMFPNTDTHTHTRSTRGLGKETKENGEERRTDLLPAS